MKIRLNLIQPSPRPVRTSWDEEKMEQLAQSIKEQGLIVPVKVRPVNGRYELVYGHRRVEASRRARLEEIDAIVEALDDTQTLLQALIENVQREDIQPMDLAYSLKALQEMTGWSQHEMARHGIMPNKTISVTLALLNEPEVIQRLVIKADDGRIPKGRITRTHVTAARESGISGESRVHVLHKAAEEGLSSKQTRHVAEAIAATSDPQKRKALLETDARSPVWEELATVRAKARQEKKAQWWDKHPSTKEFLQLLSMYNRVLRSAWQSAGAEKIAPEHLPYLIKTIRESVAKLNSIIEQLEVKAAKYH